MLKNNLKDIRLDKRLSQERLAEMIGTRATRICDIERYRRKDCLVTTALKLANALDTTVEQLFYVED